MKTLAKIIICAAVTAGGFQPARAADDTRFHGPRQRLTNPQVVAMLDSVSPGRIMANLDTLVGFYNRNTVSDTISEQRGIGAARRWIFRRFADYADDPDAVDMTPGFFSFNATICGAFSQHRNVLASIPGTRAPGRYYVISGHMDSRNISSCNTTNAAPGADDDGSGVIVSLEMARVLSRYAFEASVILMAVTGEEQGLYGSDAYAQWAQQNGVDIDGMIANDIVGNIEGCVDPACPPGDSVIIDSLSVRHFSGGLPTEKSRQLTRYMKLKGTEYLPGFDVNLIAALDRPGRSGDHVPFFNRGYAAARFSEPHEYGDGSGQNGRQHNAGDTISNFNTNAGYIANIVRLNIAGIASMALAPDPPSGLAAQNAGDGHSVFLSWPDMNSEPDFAGYRVAVRPDGQLYYSDVHDAGNVNEYLLTGLADGQRVYLSLSAYDTDDNESVFCEEIAFTPRGQPSAPSGVDAASESEGINIRWIANPELDIALYRIYRQAPGQPSPEIVRSVLHPDSAWFDSALTPHLLYRYYLTAVDVDSIESPHSDYVWGQLVTHDLGILTIDGTLDGSGNPYQPTDAAVDSFYERALAGFRFAGQWDEADSVTAGAQMTDAHLAPYSTILVYSDRLSNIMLRDDTTEIKKYLDHGGNLFVCGWKLSYSLAGNTSMFAQFPPGSFFHDYLKIDSVRVAGTESRDFVRAVSLLPGAYPDLNVDTLKAPLFSHRLFDMEAAMRPLVGGAEEIYMYESSLGNGSPLHGQPNGLRYLGADFKVFVLDIPLFFMRAADADSLVALAMVDFGENFVAVEDGEFPVPTSVIGARNYPNPFNASTIIRFAVPAESEVELGVFDLLGRQVAHVALGRMAAGSAEMIWEAADKPSGIYFYHVRVGGVVATGKMLLLK
jgi:hypothetical protein